MKTFTFYYYFSDGIACYGVVRATNETEARETLKRESGAYHLELIDVVTR